MACQKPRNMYIWSSVPTPLPPRDGLLGTMRQKALQKAFNRNDLERNKKYSSSGYSSSCMITCCYALALHLYLSTHLLLWIKLWSQDGPRWAKKIECLLGSFARLDSGQAAGILDPFFEEGTYDVLRTGTGGRKG